jgi:transcriptional regulator with XRE-family HTH domain
MRVEASIRNKIRRLRFEANEMTQAELAEKVGVTRQTLNAIEAANPHFSQGFVARRCKRMWIQGLRLRTPEAYFRYVEESEGARAQ